MKAVAVLLCLALLGGCWGYNSSAKHWSYAGDTILILGGGGAIAADLLNKPEPCMVAMATNCPYASPIRGGLVVGAILVGAGLFGMLFNATRTNVKTSR